MCGLCYKYRPELRLWNEAEQFCVETYGGHLAAVTTPQIQAALQEGSMFKYRTGTHSSTLLAYLLYSLFYAAPVKPGKCTTYYFVLARFYKNDYGIFS